MIARLALIEAKVPFTSVKLDIHRRRAQLSPVYARLNPNLTVPTLELADRVLTDSRDITLHAFPGATDEASTRWLDRHHDFPIEELRLDALDEVLADGREVLVRGVYGLADVVWTVFLARIRFIGESEEIGRRSALSRWARAMFGRASFREADVWARLAPLKLLAQVL